MKIIGRIILALLFIPIFIAIGYLAHIGAFQPLSIEEVMHPQMQLAYKDFEGSFNDLGAKVGTTMAKLEAEDEEVEAAFITLYTHCAHLASSIQGEGGAIIPTQLLERDKWGLKHKIFPSQKCLVVSFPLRSNALSIGISFFRLVPILERMQKKRGHEFSALICKVEEDKLTYILPLETVRWLDVTPPKVIETDQSEFEIPVEN